MIESKETEIMSQRKLIFELQNTTLMNYLYTTESEAQVLSTRCAE